MTQATYHVIVENGWSWIEGPTKTAWSGPWRYQWEAQEYADELNAKLTASAGEITTGEKR